jgi:Spy/CpxP family protein refolding chaperone
MKKTLSIQPTMIWLVVIMMTVAGSLQAQDRQRERSPESCGKEVQSKDKKQQIPGPFGNYEQIPGITDAQKGEIKTIRLAMIKDLRMITDQINEKEARLRTLTGAEKYDSKAVEKVIDEIAVLHADKRKRTERARHQIRSLLNEEQKLWFDQHCMRQAKGKGAASARGNHSPKRK